MPFLIVMKWMEGQAAVIGCPSRDGSGERRGSNDEIAGEFASLDIGSKLESRKKGNLRTPASDEI